MLAGYAFSEQGNAVTDGNGTYLTFVQMERLIRGSAWGEILRRDPKCCRFKRFKPRDLDVQVWARLIGANGRDLTHMSRSRRGIKTFVNGTKRLTADEKCSLVLSETWHDCGEAATQAGDVPSGCKTLAQRLAETEGLKIVVKDVLSFHKNGLADWVINVIVPVLEEPGRLNLYHRVFTKIDHFNSGIKAWGRARRTDDRELAGCLRWMAYETLTDSLPEIIGAAAEMEGAERFLAANTRRISAMFGDFAGREDDIHARMEEEGLKDPREYAWKFRRALDQWLVYQHFYPVQLGFCYAGP